MLKGPNQQFFSIFKSLMGIAVLGFSALLCFYHLPPAMLQ